MRENGQNVYDAVVVGGGLAGLTAAAILGRNGRATLVVEQAGDLGGLARTKLHEGFSFNLGPHAVYRAGHARRILRSLGIGYSAGQPAINGVALYAGREFQLPATLPTLASTRLLGLRDKMQLAGLMRRLPGLDPAAVNDQTAAAWIRANRLRPPVAALLAGLFRLSTYCADLDRLSAGVSISQLQLAIQAGVDYVDGGWQSLVNGLREVCAKSGVELVTSARAKRIIDRDGAVAGVELADGTVVPSSVVVVASGLAAAAEIAPAVARDELQPFKQARPARAASLDVALRRLPRAKPTFALGLDRPLYYSVHSAVARLAPQGAGLVHVMKYLSGEEADNARNNERELCGVLDRLQPGWRDQLVHQQFLPSITVTQHLPAAAAGGLSGRPPVRVRSVRGLYLAGEGIGSRGLLADAALASGEEAANLIAANRDSPAGVVAA